MVPDRAVKQYANPPPRRSAKPRRGPPLDRVRSHLREADPVLARLIDARPTFDPQGWMAELRAMDLFGALLFQVAGQQLSVAPRAKPWGASRCCSWVASVPGQTARGAARQSPPAGLSWREVATLRDPAELAVLPRGSGSRSAVLRMRG
jgi:hypothetical protein